jgi:hypothetical protein
MIKFETYGALSSEGVRMYPTYYGGNSKWNFTDKQRDFITNLYVPQIVEHITVQTVRVLRMESILNIIENIRGQISEARTRLDGISDVLALDKFNGHNLLGR